MNKIYFLNSANFDYTQIDLSKKNLFFVGDNGSGKTTAIRAIQYFFNSDSKALGIDSNKLSFKEFYFKYENSYIIYEFDNFFVFTYKRNGEIKKIFSKQKLDISKFFKDDVVVELKEALNYVKSAEIKKIVSTNDEFRRIIYGMDQNFIDFKITTIRDYKKFINLYNKIFNVNKAVFDISSIKDTIFTTLDLKDGGEIRYENFLIDIKEYSKYFNFYQKFKSQQKNISDLYTLKNSILEKLQTLEDIKSQISYKKDIELTQLENLKKELLNLENRINKLVVLQGKLYKKSDNVIYKIEKNIRELKIEIEELKKLKKEFSLEKINSAKNLILKADDLQKKRDDLKLFILSLKDKTKSLAQKIEEEINLYKKEISTLKENISLIEIQIKREEEEKLYELIENKKEQFNQEENNLQEEVFELDKKIKEIEEKIDTINSQIKEIKRDYSKKIEKTTEKFENLKHQIKKEINTLYKEIDKNQEEEYKLKKNLNRLQLEFDKQKEKIEKEKKEHIKTLNEKILFYENIIKTKPNSFKEFLNSNVEDWEKFLYPILDEAVLNIDISKLKPKIVSSPILGLTYDTKELKTIPTRKEAEKAIEKLKKEIEIITDEANIELEKLKKEFMSKKIEINSEIEVLKESNEKLYQQIEDLKNELKKLETNLNREIEELNSELKEELKKFEIKIENLKEIQKNYISTRKDKLNRINILKKELKKSIEQLKSKIKKNINEKIKKAKSEIKTQIDKLYKKIDETKNKNISSNEKEKEILKELQEIEQQLKEIEKAKSFLNFYEKKKDEIEKIKDKKECLIKLQEKNKEFNNFTLNLFVKIESKIKELNSKKNSIETEITKINQGLKESQKLNISTENKLKTDKFLIELIEDYLNLKRDIYNIKVELKYKADKIKTALLRFAIEGMEVNFNLEELDKLHPIELEKIDELYLFSNKKFEVLNKTTIENLRNLIDGVLNKKIDIFEEAKEDFILQVEKVNKNLKKIDFGVIKNIKFNIVEEKKNILKLFEKIKNIIINVTVLLDEGNLFFDLKESKKLLLKIEDIFNEIKSKIEKDSFSLIDVIDMNLSFTENNKPVHTKVIKEESSTGGSILLKIAIAVSLLELFLKEDANLFLILDEVSVLSTKNQKLLKEFVNEKGLGVIYVTPDLPLVDVENIDIYKFRSVGDKFEAIQLITKEGVKI